MDLKAAAAESLAGLTDEAIDLSHQIHARPEVAFEEYFASEQVAGWLGRKGFDVTREVAGLPTALEASFGDGDLVLAFFAEYDALPGIGHACGHNIIGAASVAAAMLVAPMAKQLGVTVKVFGTPAEEEGGGKILMLENDAFAGVHAALMVHPAPIDMQTFPALAAEHLYISYEGRTAHASGCPHLGRNAADAFTVAQVGIGLLRQHLHPGVQVHGVITDGGEAPNVVPGHTDGRFYIRARTADDLRVAHEQVGRCFEAGALATGCELQVTEGPAYSHLAPDLGLELLYRANAEALGRRFTEVPPGARWGSTDMGNVSQVIPAIHPMIGLESAGSVGHQPEFAAHCAEPTGDRAVLDGALALAWTAIDVATNGEHRERLLAMAG